MKKHLILLDNGHGENTPGKRSPDGKFREYLYTREIAKEVRNELIKKGIDCELLVTESYDVSLGERVRRVNEYCKKLGTKNVILVSIHVNAAGEGTEWLNARGFAVYTSKGQTKSDELAEFIVKAAKVHHAGHYIRADKSDGDSDWEANFAVLKNTKCTAVLVENFFMDNKDDVAYLNSDKGKEAVIKTHVDGIIKYLENINKI